MNTPKKHTNLFLNSIAALFMFTACSGGGGGGGGSSPGGPQDPAKPDPDVVLAECNHVVTEEAIRKFNQQQNEHRVRAAGMNSYCEAEVNENGVVRKVKKVGMTHIEVLPRWQAKSIAATLADGISFDNFVKIVVKSEDSQSLTDEKKNEILAAVGVKKKEEEQVVLADTGRTFSYVRLGAMILPIESFGLFNTDDKIYNKLVTIFIPTQARSFVNQLVKDVKDGNLAADFISRDGENLGTNKIKFESDKFSQWQIENSIQALKKHAALRDRGLGQYAVQTSVRYVFAWSGLTPQEVHAAIPELYSWADRYLRNESIGSANAEEHLLYMRYVTVIHPQHEKAELYALSARLNRYTRDSYESLSTANSWLRDKTYSKEQIDFILGSLDLLAPHIPSLNLQDGVELARETSWSSERRDLIVNVVAGFKQLQIFSGRELLKEAAVRIGLGLNAQNLQGYWQTWEILKSYSSTTYGVTLKKLVAFADTWYLQQKISHGEMRKMTLLASWIREKANGDAVENLNRVNELVRIAPMDEAQVNSYKTMFQYLNSELYMNLKDVLAELQELHRLFQLQETPLATLKDLSKFFSGTLYLNNKEAYSKAKSFVQNGVATPAQYADLKTHVKWLTDGMYLNAKEALNRTEGLLFTNKLNGPQLEVIRAAVKWLAGELFMNNKEALARGESYVVQNAMDAAKFQRLQAEYKAGYNKHFNSKKALAEAEKLILGRE